MSFAERLILFRSEDAVHIRCPAKVNLFLRVLERRSDGYREVQNVMRTVTLFDELEVRKQGAGIALVCSGENVGASAEENLAFRAAELFLRNGYGTGGVHLDLKKNIPVAAGLGGGSSDAGCCLLALNELFGARLSAGCLRSLAAELGSDVPFFVEGETALCTGRGEIVRRLRGSLHFGGILLAPEARLKTPEMYKSLTSEDRHGPDVNVMLDAIESGDLRSVCSALFNSFEKLAFRQVPELTRLRSALEELGSIGVVLCGSGPVLLGIFPSVKEAVTGLQRLTPEAVRQKRFAAVIGTF